MAVLRDRPHQLAMNITGRNGLDNATIATLKAIGAVEDIGGELSLRNFTASRPLAQKRGWFR
jgi:hypothetical protein